MYDLTQFLPPNTLKSYNRKKHATEPQMGLQDIQQGHTKQFSFTKRPQIPEPIHIIPAFTCLNCDGYTQTQSQTQKITVNMAQQFDRPQLLSTCQQTDFEPLSKQNKQISMDMNHKLGHKGRLTLCTNTVFLFMHPKESLQTYSISVQTAYDEVYGNQPETYTRGHMTPRGRSRHQSQERANYEDNQIVGNTLDRNSRQSGRKTYQKGFSNSKENQSNGNTQRIQTKVISQRGAKDYKQLIGRRVQKGQSSTNYTSVNDTAHKTNQRKYSVDGVGQLGLTGGQLGFNSQLGFNNQLGSTNQLGSNYRAQNKLNNRQNDLPGLANILDQWTSRHIPTININQSVILQSINEKEVEAAVQLLMEW